LCHALKPARYPWHWPWHWPWPTQQSLTRWLAGLQPQLLPETGPDGQIWVNTHLAAGDGTSQQRHCAHEQLLSACVAEKAVPEAAVNTAKGNVDNWVMARQCSCSRDATESDVILL
jgi:hypothetical protein